ncbi:MAG: proton-conducting transporter membrane subunit, partial [Halobacteriovoraceae bacterium]|nr:proton-conducting transporter membrane subunit [Halobacteriovoraceae bacterium]
PSANLDRKRCKIWGIAGSLLCLFFTINFILIDRDFSSLPVYSGKTNNISGLSYQFLLSELGNFFLIINSIFLLISILSTFKENIKKIKLYYFLMFFSYWIANAAMYSANLYSYYIFWELIFIPLLILAFTTQKTSKEKGEKFKLLMYFSASSVIMFGAIIFMASSAYLSNGSFNLNPQIIKELISKNDYFFSSKDIIFWFLTSAILMRISAFPFHNWLPDFCEQSPTSSIITSLGFLVNIAIYGLIKFVIPSFNEILNEFNDVFIIIGIIGLIYFPLLSIKQKTTKNVLIYCYLSHISLVITAIFTLNPSIIPNIIYYISNMFLALMGLFYLIYYLELKKINTSIVEFKKYMQKDNMFFLVFFIFIISFIPFLPTSGFAGLITALIYIYKYNKIMGILSVIGISLNIFSLFNAFFKKSNMDLISYKKTVPMNFVEIVPIVLISVLFTIGFLFPQKIINNIGGF